MTTKTATKFQQKRLLQRLTRSSQQRHRPIWSMNSASWISRSVETVAVSSHLGTPFSGMSTGIRCASLAQSKRSAILQGNPRLPAVLVSTHLQVHPRAQLSHQALLGSDRQPCGRLCRSGYLAEVKDGEQRKLPYQSLHTSWQYLSTL